MKTGSTGALCFVSVDHERDHAARHSRSASGTISSIATLRRLKRRARQARRPPPVAQHRETHFADPVLLFRYSALTFNGHRIHYDRDYVTKVEGYPGLIFHGPMQAALHVEFAAKLRSALRRRNSPIAACSRYSRAASSRSTPTRWRPGALDRQFEGSRP